MAKKLKSKEKILVLIPARKGSSRVKNKNIRNVKKKTFNSMDNKFC